MEYSVLGLFLFDSQLIFLQLGTYMLLGESGLKSNLKSPNEENTSAKLRFLLGVPLVILDTLVSE